MLSPNYLYLTALFGNTVMANVIGYVELTVD